MNLDQIQVPVETIIRKLQDQNSQLALRVITLESYMEVIQQQDSAAESPDTEPTQRLTAQDIQERVQHTQSGE